MSKPPTFSEPYWAWESKKNNLRSAYMSMEGRVSVTDLMTHLRKIAPYVGPDDVFLNFATARWRREANEEELAERAKAHRRHDERHERWERETYARLKAKYEGEAA